MKSRTQKNPLRRVQNRGGAYALPPGATLLTRRVVPDMDQISTWLYDAVDRRARETFETLSILRPREKESRWA